MQQELSAAEPSLQPHERALWELQRWPHLVKCLLFKHEDPEMVPRRYVKDGHSSTFVISVLGRQDSRILRVYQCGQLVSSSFKDPVSKIKVTSK